MSVIIVYRGAEQLDIIRLLFPFNNA